MSNSPAVVVGRVPVLEALRAGRRTPRKLFLLEGARDLGALEQASRKVPVQWLNRPALDKLSGGVVHQGVVLHADPLPLLELKGWLATSTRGTGPVLLLDEVEDPQNFGAMVRSAAALAAAAVVFGRDRAAPVSPASVKAAAGAMDHVDLVQVANIPRAMEQLKEAGYWITGLDAAGEKLLWEVDFCAPSVLVIGSEGKGMRKLVRDKCDLLARIPIAGAITSLNASVSAALALAEAARQRHTAASR